MHLTEWCQAAHDHGDRFLPTTDQIAIEWRRIATILAFDRVLS
nr:hypothetical protein [Ensifer adhaerens]